MLEGQVLEGDVLKVGGFLNHRIDTRLCTALGEEFARLFRADKPDKVLTVEASGIASALCTAISLDVPLIFAKKKHTDNLSGPVYSANIRSYTTNTDCEMIVARELIERGERILIIDDFLASGQAALGLLEIVRQARASAVGCGFVVEKAFQPGGELLRGQGLHVESLARIKEMSVERGIVFCE